MLISKGLFINIGLSLASILLLFGSAELALRAMGRTTSRKPPPIYQTHDDPRISYSLKPRIHEKVFRSTIVTNSLGFRSPELDYNKPLIAVLGDSMIFGYGVENDETVPARMQEMLPGYTVLNAGVPGYHLGQEAALFEKKILPLKPEILVLVFYPNDFEARTSFLDEEGILRAENWVPGGSECSPPEKGIFALNRLHCNWMGKSVFYKSFYKLSNTIHGKRSLKSEQKASQDNPEEDSVTQEQLEAYEHQMDILMTSMPLDFPRLFVIWPDRFLHPTAVPALIDFALEREFLVLNIYNYFGNEMPTLGWDTVHANPETLEKIAEIIVEKLTKEQIL